VIVKIIVLSPRVRMMKFLLKHLLYSSIYQKIDLDMIPKCKKNINIKYASHLPLISRGR
jgi:uncharacterized membrane protein